MPQPLPPFNPDATCAKCGHDKVNMRFARADSEFMRGFRGWDWLTRRCDRCGYHWYEQCLDAEGASAAPQ